MYMTDRESSVEINWSGEDIASYVAVPVEILLGQYSNSRLNRTQYSNIGYRIYQYIWFTDSVPTLSVDVEAFLLRWLWSRLPDCASYNLYPMWLSTNIGSARSRQTGFSAQIYAQSIHWSNLSGWALSSCMSHRDSAPQVPTVVRYIYRIHFWSPFDLTPFIESLHPSNDAMMCAIFLVPWTYTH